MALLESWHPTFWDRRYQQGSDGWELGRAAPPIAGFLAPGCGRGHEAARLAGLGFDVVGLDFSGEALVEARSLHGEGEVGVTSGRLSGLQADLFDGQAREAAGLGAGSLSGWVEHTCFCAIDPGRRPAYGEMVQRLLTPEGWFLGLFWCHDRSGGPPWG